MKQLVLKRDPMPLHGPTLDTMPEEVEYVAYSEKGKDVVAVVKRQGNSTCCLRADTGVWVPSYDPPSSWTCFREAPRQVVIQRRREMVEGRVYCQPEYRAIHHVLVGGVVWSLTIDQGVCSRLWMLTFTNECTLTPTEYTASLEEVV